MVKSLADCVLPIIQLIEHTISQPGKHCDTILKAMSDIAEKCPQYLRCQFDILIQLCLKSLESTFISDTRKHLCIEIVVSWAENAPSTMRKRGASYLGQLGKKFCRKLCSTIFECHSHPSLPCRVNYLLLMMTRLDEDDEWESEDSLEDDFER